MKIRTFIVNNKWPLVIGVAVYGMFLFFTISGNRICDCVSTEKSNPNTNNSGRGGVSRFYHK